MVNFHGYNKTKSYFEGWYFKHQQGKETIAFIPGINIDQHGKKSAFIQVITNTNSHHIEYLFSDFKVSKDRLGIKIGNNIFCSKGIQIDIQNKDISIRGQLQYGAFMPLKYDIMGPFSIFPWMECNHGVLSLFHTLNGSLNIDDRIIKFNGGTGYIEKDWGSSFPKTYLWTQCNHFETDQCCIMVSIADIPFVGLNFKGCICVVYFGGKEYRLSTYTGVKIIRYDQSGLTLQQGRYQLEVNLLQTTPQKLFAPSRGDMTRTIHENAACTARYRFTIADHLLFDLRSEQASFEFVES